MEFLHNMQTYPNSFLSNIYFKALYIIFKSTLKNKNKIVTSNLKNIFLITFSIMRNYFANYDILFYYKVYSAKYI